MQQVLAKFGILQVARTGKISLKRGEELLEMGGWGDGQRSRQPRREQASRDDDSDKSGQNGAKHEDHQEGSDVYAVDSKQSGDGALNSVRSKAGYLMMTLHAVFRLKVEIHVLVPPFTSRFCHCMEPAVHLQS